MPGDFLVLLATLVLQGSARRETSRYDVTVPDRGSTRVEVTASLPASDLLRMSEYGAWSQARGWATFVTELQVGAGASAVTARPDGRHAWRLDPPPTERIHLRYVVDLAHARDPGWPDGARTTSAWREGEATFALMGALLVHGEGESAVELRFHLPDGWRVRGPWHELEPGRFTIESVEKATRNVAVFGVFEERRFSVGELAGSIVSLEAEPDVADLLASIAASCLGSYAELFGILRLLARQSGTGFPPGTRQSYCNSGYTLLAEVVERASGLSFRELMAQRVFGPLGMASTCFADDPHEVVPARAASYEVVPGGYRGAPLNFGTVGATGLLTTSEDLARWGTDLLTFRVVRKELLEAMLRPRLMPDGLAMDFVNGLHAGEVDGHATFGHPGADAGFRGAVLVVPDERLVVALLGNFDTLDMWALPDRIAGVYFSARRPPSPRASDPEPSAEPARTATEPSDVDLSEFEGTYFSLELGTVYELEIEYGRLRARHARNGTLELTPVAADRFSCGRWFLRDIRFVRDVTERVVGFDASSSRSQGTRFERVSR